MPRIYAKNENHCNGWAGAEFINGVAVVVDSRSVAYFSALSDYVVDPSRDALEVWDKLPGDEVDKIVAYLGLTITPAGDVATKQEKCHAIENWFSTKLITSLTIASAAATTKTGATKITITSPGEYDYYCKTGTAAPAALYGDTPDETWQLLELTAGVADDVVPNAADDTKIAVVRVDENGKVIGYKSGNLTVKT